MAVRTFTRTKPVLLVLLLVSLASVARANVSITLSNSSGTARDYDSYMSTVFYDTSFSSIDSSGMIGYLHQPDPKDGCSPISRGPNSSNATGSWFAVIEYFPHCSLVAMVKNLKDAGYQLVILADETNPNLSATPPDVGLTPEVRKMDFPIVIISEMYTDYLINNTLSTFSDPDVEAMVTANGDLFILVLVMASIFVVVPLCMICCALCCYWRALRLRRYQEVAGIQHRQRNFARLTDHDRIARRELIDSILRQLQQLQLEGEVQQPLGVERTRKLPTRKYEPASTPESCAICVEDFKDRDVVRVLPCNHFFHIKCIDEWLTNHSDMCPLCKSPVPRDKPEDHHTGGRGAALASFDETEETDSESQLLSAELRPRQGRVYGSV